MSAKYCTTCSSPAAKSLCYPIRYSGQHLVSIYLASSRVFSIIASGVHVHCYCIQLPPHPPTCIYTCTCTCTCAYMYVYIVHVYTCMLLLYALQSHVMCNIMLQGNDLVFIMCVYVHVHGVRCLWWFHYPGLLLHTLSGE